MTKLTGINTVIDRIIQNLVSITETLANHKNYITDLEKRVKELEEKVNDHKV